MSEHIWERVLARVEAKLNRHTFLTWFKPTRFIRENGDTLMVEVPDGTVRDWLLRHYGSILAEALAEAGRPGASSPSCRPTAPKFPNPRLPRNS